MIDNVVARRRVHLMFTVAAIGLGAATPSLASAQEAAGPGDDMAEESGENIVVTGTRIQRPEAATATPVVSVTSENIVQ